MARAKIYSVYDKKTGCPVAIAKTAKECAELMGITYQAFRNTCNRLSKGGFSPKWEIYDDGDAEPKPRRRRKKPCDRCTRCKNPMDCENKNCQPWREWFFASWKGFNRFYEKHGVNKTAMLPDHQRNRGMEGKK